MLSFQGKTVLITGASGVIGQACATLFRQQGARLALTDLSVPPREKSDSTDDCFIAADASVPNAVSDAYERFSSELGPIDAAVLAAGIEGPVCGIEDLSVNDLDKILAVNVRGSLLWLQQCLRDMKTARSGSIVLLSSISGVVGTGFLGAYTISKHAVIGLMRATALEVGPLGIRVNAICPGPVKSEMMQRLDAAFIARDPQRFGGGGDASKALPLQRYVTAKEVAAMAAFLCSEDASSCHGGTYMVDGGFTAR
ncbi:SDR family NAD(P)-dependent oxidoreductase [Novispirillum itersonii]|uniref:SDR family NAD(P)-dependent oxidoreductase n=1 Tax=Novispirillum itersonii TaxID=189 RepID=UPI00037F62A4|nr:SDR family oxidoreductase [Novispirillum itersonii]